VNGLIDEARAAGMTIVGITVGRRNDDGSLRALNEEELPKPKRSWAAASSTSR
jgi:nicotinamidase-related amidase